MRTSPVFALLVLAPFLAACSESSTAAAAPAPIPPIEWSFGGDALGSVPQGFTAVGGSWQVVEEATAPGDRQVVAQTASSAADDFNLLLLETPRCHDVSLVVSILPVEGEVDQGGGLVWRARDERNYYLARYNPLEKNLRLYAVVDGERRQLASAKLELKPGWHNVAIQMRGDVIDCFVDGHSYVKLSDKTFGDEGRIGLWTKADARTRFDDLRMRAYN